MHAQKLLLKDDTDKQVKSTNEANKFQLPMVRGTKKFDLYVHKDRQTTNKAVIL